METPDESVPGGGSLPRLGLRIPPCVPVRELAAAAVAAQDAGFDCVLLPDSQLIWRDAFASLTAIALATSRIRLGTAVTNLATRHLTVLASVARTLQEASDGRFILGLGRGDSSVALVGLPTASPSQMRGAIEDLRALLAGRAVSYPGGPVRLRDPGRTCPVFVAASGPRMVAVAGAVADGVIILSGLTDEAVRQQVGRVRAGVTSAGRSHDPEFWLTAYAVVTDDIGESARQLGPLCLNVALNGGAEALASAGIQVSIPRARPMVYPDLVHAEDWAEAVSASARYVPAQAARAFAEQFCLVGTVPQITARLRRLRSLGITGVYLQQVGSYELPADLIERLAPTTLAALSPSLAPMSGSATAARHPGRPT